MGGIPEVFEVWWGFLKFLRCDEEITLGLLNTLFILFCRF